MKPIAEMKLIQIEITNACIFQCSNCTRFVGHHRRPFFMNLDTVEDAIDSLEGFPGNIGIQGGEPTLHPKFREICKILQRKVPDRRRRELWTTGHKWNEYKDIILETFDKDLIAYNDHSSSDGKHHPMLVAVNDVIDDKKEMWKLIDKCWVNDRWSASITPKGCFFCEIAAALDHLFDGPGGYPIKKDWWKKDPIDQVKRYCHSCGAVVPIGETSDHATYDIISSSNAEKMIRVGSPKLLAGNCLIYGRKWGIDEIKRRQKGWKPFNFRTFYAHTPEDIAKNRKNKEQG